MGVLSKAGVEPIDAVGKLFDPHWHEAMTHQPSDTVPAEHVVAQTRRGYKMGDKLLQAAQVLVSSGPAPSRAKNLPRARNAIVMMSLVWPAMPPKTTSRPIANWP